ncbi:hypothetical protein [uncultured Bacteroides sp.]|uniref:hypothetical protein n=1 Tax=uncultured Bacteroides sp. TaxID=162156 RepID=UPI002637BE39|nr:hypothetical protein [uncultured Bacteroides sp.]
MGAIGLNPIRLDRIGLDPIRINAIKLGVPGAASGTNRPYIDPEVLASLKAVCICYGKSNDDPDRAVVKNLVDPDNPFVISNAAFKLNSGFGKYEVDFTSWIQTNGVIASSDKVQNSIIGRFLYFNTVNKKEDVPSFKVNITLGQQGKLQYNYIEEDGTSTYIVYSESGIYTIPASYFSKYTGGNAWFGFYQIEGTSIIEQIPSFEGAFVTDGIDDLITSTKTVQEMLGGSNEITVVSLITHISGTGKYNIIGDGGIQVSDYSGQTFMAGTSSSGEKIVELGDKEKLQAVQYTTFDSKLTIGLEDSSYAYYGTFVFNKENVPVDWIHQVIAYFNLDRCVEPTVWYDVQKQGLSNDTPDSDWYLKDYSGNGYDMTLYNYAKTPESGINEDGGLQSDGVDDYGKVTGLPIYKDYTVVADYVRTFAKENVQDAPILSKSQVAGDGAFLFNYLNVNSVISSYSFGTNNVLTNVSDSERKIYYQSKYVNGGKSINSGTGTDYDSMWLGTYRDDSQIFFTGAIYSLMTFPYSMSEFLIERQLKKHKLGTLYPDMVEWRPIYTSNVNDYTITKATYFGEEGQRDLDLGNHYPIDTRFRIYVKPSGAVDEVTSIKVNGVELTYDYIGSNYGYAFNGTLSSKSPQKIDITIDEYIRYEDIDFTDCYPGVPRIYVDDKSVTWGNKLKVGDKFTFYGNVNILPEMYNVLVKAKYNGEEMTYGSIGTITKSMAFTSFRTYTFNSNEPKCILSPSRLRIPNSSYKILGYIPDISGHGNHGVIHNSAYALNSGANGYLVDFNSWFAATGVDRTDNKVTLNSNYNLAETFVCYASPNSVVVPTFKVHITGIPNGGTLFFNRNSEIVNLVNGENTIEGYTSTTYSGFKRGEGLELDWSNLVIQQIGEYEGAYCLDGVDDFITIPTLSVGGKQVLMKVNWQSSIGQGMLYDQRGTAFAIWNSDKYNDDETDTIPAYSARNGGNTYIDGILNKNILASQLRNITHNIVATNTMLNGSSVSPTIGCRTEHDAYFTNMSLYDFMLFDEIDSDEEILTLNEYVGIEGNTDDLFTENN